MSDVWKNHEDVCAFEVLAGTKNLGNLKTIDEHPRSKAEINYTTQQMNVTWYNNDRQTIVNFPPECLIRFEPIYIRVQMLWRRTLVEEEYIQFPDITDNDWSYLS